jgi:anti-sigma factor RsiW
MGATLRMKLDHRWSMRRLSAYLDGELTPRRRRRLEAHAAVCPECGPLLRSLKLILLELRTLGLRREHVVAESVVERLRRERPLV